MNNLSKKMWFKVIAFILINSFLLLDITWAGGGEIFTLKQVDYLSPSLTINNQIVIENFQRLHEIKSGSKSLTEHVIIENDKKVFVNRDSDRLLLEQFDLDDAREVNTDIGKEEFPGLAESKVIQPILEAETPKSAKLELPSFTELQLINQAI